MKTTTAFLYALLTASLFISISCDKEYPYNSFNQSPPPPPPPPPPPNQTIRVKALPDVTIELPMNFAMLNGSLSGPLANIATVNWEKISGPASYHIEQPGSAYTKVTNLEPGVYQFRITATTSSGEIVSDSITINVLNANSPVRQIIFSRLDWVCPFGCSIWLGYVSPYLAANTPIEVYIKREGSQLWDIVVHDSVVTTERYFYSIDYGQLSVLENSNIDATDHPEVKIIF